jgi:hypothetical protein
LRVRRRVRRRAERQKVGERERGRGRVKPLKMGTRIRIRSGLMAATCERGVCEEREV